jgi:hypothetical protein
MLLLYFKLKLQVIMPEVLPDISQEGIICSTGGKFHSSAGRSF